MKWGWDIVDDWCAEWAITRRRIYGVTLDKMLMPHERLGKLRSTLGAISDEKVAAGERVVRIGENGHLHQDWPEVYTPMGMMIHRCQLTMTEEMRQTLHLHYVFDLGAQWPLSERCRAVGITVHNHWKAVSAMKIYINGFVAATPEPRDTESVAG